MSFCAELCEITATNPSPVGMGVGRGSKKESRLKGGRRVHEPPSRKSSKARAKASAPPREEALDDDNDPLHDVQHSVQSGGMTWRMLIPSEQGLRGKAGISSLGSTVGMNDVSGFIQLWGAQNQPMKFLPGGGKSKRVYVCRHPVFGTWSTRCPARKSTASATATDATCPATAESLAATEVCAF